MKKIAFNCHDFGMFDGELNAYEYEFFYKHTGAFKRMMKDEPNEQKQKFLDAFCEFFLNHGEMKALSTMADHKKKYVETFRKYAQETFINGKFSAAKQFLNDAVIVAKNQHLMQYMDSQSYAKDPFFNKETRDVFRRLFGQPNEAGTCVKVICLLPMFVKFAGSLCRYLRLWLDADETETSTLVKSGGKLQKTKKKEEEAKSKPNDTPALMVFKMEGSPAQEIRRTATGEHQIRQIDDTSPYMAAAGFAWPHIVDHRKEKKHMYRNDDIDRDLRKHRREERMNREKERMKERSREAENKRLKKEKMDEVKRSMAEANVGSKATDKINSATDLGVKNVESANSDSKNLEGKTSEGKIAESKIPEGKIPDEKTPEDNTPEDETLEGKILEGKVLEGKIDEEKKLEKQSEEKHLLENGVTVDDSSDSNVTEDLYIKELLPGLHLGEPHPNKVYDNMVEEKEEKERSRNNSWNARGSTKLRNCAFCRSMENEPKVFKKCQRCKGKGTRFYCSRNCQKSDWPKHRLEHEN